jgi:hypothetical protein
MNPNKRQKLDDKCDTKIFLEENNTWLGAVVSDTITVNNKIYSTILPLEKDMLTDTYSVKKESVPIVRELNNCIDTVNVFSKSDNKNKQDSIDKKWIDVSGITSKYIFNKKRKFHTLPTYNKIKYLQEEMKYLHMKELITNIRDLLHLEFNCSYTLWNHIGFSKLFSNALTDIKNNTMIVIENFDLLDTTTLFNNLENMTNQTDVTNTSINLVINKNISNTLFVEFIKDILNKIFKLNNLPKNTLISISYVDKNTIPITMIDFINDTVVDYSYKNKYNLIPLTTMKINVHEYTTLFYTFEK